VIMLSILYWRCTCWTRGIGCCSGTFQFSIGDADDRRRGGNVLSHSSSFNSLLEMPFYDTSGVGYCPFQFSIGDAAGKTYHFYIHIPPKCFNSLLEMPTPTWRSST